MPRSTCLRPVLFSSRTCTATRVVAQNVVKTTHRSRGEGVDAGRGGKRSDNTLLFATPCGYANVPLFHLHHCGPYIPLTAFR